MIMLALEMAGGHVGVEMASDRVGVRDGRWSCWY